MLFRSDAARGGTAGRTGGVPGGSLVRAGVRGDMDRERGDADQRMAAPRDPMVTGTDGGELPNYCSRRRSTRRHDGARE